MINIDKLIKEAMKSRNNIALNTYRNIKSEIQKNQTAKGAKPLTEESQLQIISKYTKKLEDSISQFSEIHRDDLVLEYTSELEIVKKLLPESVKESEIYLFIENDENFFDKFYKTFDNENSLDYQNGGEETYMMIEIPKKEMGNAIKYLKSKFPTADGKMISKIVKNYIV